MKRRGRSVVDQTAAVIIAGSFGERAEPPVKLTPRQLEIWREIVASEPNEFFATAALRYMLVDLCRHRDAAETLSALIDRIDATELHTELNARHYRGLLKMRTLEVKGVTMLATKLRLTNQSRYLTRTAAAAATNEVKGSKPWDQRKAS